MIIGHGDIASALKDHKDFLFFASGVSNSITCGPKEFNREMDLLLKQPIDKHLVYFSSLSIYYSDTYYTTHKLAMETAVINIFPKYTIVRMGNITWGSNPNTIINYFRNRILNRKSLEIKNTFRFIVDKETFKKEMESVKEIRQPELNIHGDKLHITEIVNRIKKGLL